MLTSLLRYPKGDRYIQIHQSLLAACDGNACAAALIRFFERFHRYKAEQKEYTELFNQMAGDVGIPSIFDTSGWQFHTYEQLRKGVMIYAEDTIRSAIKLLERKEFINTEVPDRLRMLYKTGRTQWFLLRADKINEWLDKYELDMRPKKLVFPPRRAAAEKFDKSGKPMPTGSVAEVAMKVFDYKAERRVEFWKRRGKDRRKPQVSAEILLLIIERLKRFKPEELAYAVEGNLASAYHQGDNPTQTVYDDITKIFASVESVNKFIGYAESNGVNFAKVAARFNAGTLALNASSAPTQADYEALANVAVPYIEDSDYDYQRTLDAFRNVKAKIVPFDTARFEKIVKERLEGTVGIYGEEHKNRFRTLITNAK